MLRKLVVIALLVVCCCGLALAQRGHNKDLSGDVFGADFYLRPLKAIAGSYAPELTFARFPENDCVPDQVNVTCFAIDDLGILQKKTLTDVAHIVIPAGTARDLLVFEARNFSSVYFRTGDIPYPDNAVFVYNPTVTIESPVLPAPITAGLGHKRIAKMVSPGEEANEDAQYSRTYRLSRSLMKEAMGYSDATIDAFFANPITIRMNIELRVKQVEYADGFYDFMLYGY